LDEAARTISAIGIDQHVRDAAKAHIDRAIKSIENYDNSGAKKALESSAKFIVERSM
jgi:geranylgeranyl diphosphate synthase type I